MRLADLLNIETLRKLAEANYNANGMPIGILDAVDGSVLVGFGWQDICTMYHRANDITAARCRESDKHIEQHLSDQKQCEYKCKNGLRDIGVPIRVGGEHLATLFLGQFFYEGEAPDRAFFVAQARQFGFEEAAYLAALDRVPVFSRSSVENILKYDTALAAFISDLAEAALRSKRAEVRAASLARFPQENPDPVLRLALDFRVVYANAAAHEALSGLGIAVGATAPQPILEFAHRAVADAQRVQGELSTGEHSYSVSVEVVADDVNVYAHNITTRVRAEEALRESESRYRMLFQNMLEGSAYCRMLFDEHGRPEDFVYLDVNSAFERLTGLHGVIGKKVTEVIPGIKEAHPELLETYGRVARTGLAARFDIHLLPLGKWLSVSVYGTHRDHFVAVFDDITSRKEAEETLSATMQRLQSLLENSPLAVIEWSSVDFRVSRWSEEATRMFGWTAAETVGKRIDELDSVYPEDWPAVQQVMEDMLSGRRPRNVNKNRNYRKDGSVIHCEWYNSAFADSTGKLVAVLSLVLDVTERKRVEKELRDADIAKDNFLGMLSHELRNPLAPIQNALYVLDHAEPAGQQARRAKEIAGRQLAHLTRLVDDLLDVTRIVRGKVELRRTDLDIAELARRTGEDHRALMHERGLDFDIDGPQEPVWVDGDETRLAQVIGNLLQNAAKFTPDGGRVTLSVVAQPDAVEVRVRDTGSGIDADLLAHIFDPFVQGKQSLARREGGLGLGLALVKGLVELHGGTVAVTSAGRDQGAKFVVRLPLLGVGAEVGHRPRVPERLAPGTARRRRVLVIEDNEDAATLLQDALELEGHEVHVSVDGLRGVEAALRIKPEVILCDIGLPGIDGYEVARRLRDSTDREGPLLIAVTGYTSPEDVRRASDAGFHHHFGKPPDMQQLSRAVAAGPHVGSA